VISREGHLFGNFSLGFNLGSLLCYVVNGHVYDIRSPIFAKLPNEGEDIKLSASHKRVVPPAIPHTKVEHSSLDNK
jgi:hypothetical protein